MGNTVNTRIKMLRTSLNLSQVDFANQCKLSPSLISKIESGERESTFKVTDAIISAFGVDESWLVQGIGEMSYKQRKRIDIDPWKEEAFKALKDEVAFYRQIITNLTGGKGASFQVALSGTGLRKRRSLGAAA